jgi:hypothetical protein
MPVGDSMSIAGIEVSEALVAHRARQVLKYTPSEFGWQDVWWQGERIGMVKREDRGAAPWHAISVSGMSPGFFGTRRSAGAHLRRLIEKRRSA